MPGLTVPGAVPALSLRTPSVRWTPSGLQVRDEPLAEEAPLTIEIGYRRGAQPVVRLLATTMRTPGNDDELALGFLHAEGLIAELADVAGSTALEENCRGEAIATLRVELTQPPSEDFARISRSLLTSSACGLCGRPGLQGLPLGRKAPEFSPASHRWRPELVAELPEMLRAVQVDFERTGGSHAAGLAGPCGRRLLLVREDVGRHNAVDKVVGAALRTGMPLAGQALVLSGRASFELLQKAAAAGIELVVAVGAPSSLALRLAHEANITLVGFARAGRFNLYTHASRLAVRCPAP
ncbi:MAG: formate dehydrogenase accessory sulfurtransferase FdhD [Opitutaceae bacterium]